LFRPAQNWAATVAAKPKVETFLNAVFGHERSTTPPVVVPKKNATPAGAGAAFSTNTFISTSLLHYHFKALDALGALHLHHINTGAVLR
jgi:hypothetical protein